MCRVMTEMGGGKKKCELRNDGSERSEHLICEMKEQLAESLRKGAAFRRFLLFCECFESKR